MFLMRFDILLRALLATMLSLIPSIWMFRMVSVQIRTLTPKQYDDLCNPDVFIPFEKRYNIRILFLFLFLIMIFTGLFMFIFYLSDLGRSLLIAKVSFYYAEYGSPFSPNPISTDMPTYVASIIIRSFIISVPFAYGLLFLITRHIFQERFYLVLFPYAKYDRHLCRVKTEKEILAEPKAYPQICTIISLVLFIACLVSSCFSYFTPDRIVLKYGMGPTVRTYEYHQLIEIHHFSHIICEDGETFPINGCFFLMSDGKAYFIPQLPDAIEEQILQRAPYIIPIHHYLYDINNPPFEKPYFPAVYPFTDLYSS